MGYEEWLCNHYDPTVFWRYQTFIRLNFPEIHQECVLAWYRIKYTLIESLRKNIFSEWSMLSKGYRKNVIENRDDVLRMMKSIADSALSNMQDLETTFDRCTID